MITLMFSEKQDFEELSLTEWRNMYKYQLQEALEQMHVDCANIGENCSSMLSRLASTNGIVCLRKR